MSFEIGQTWQRRERSRWKNALAQKDGTLRIDARILKVRNIYRAENTLLVNGEHGEKAIVSFKDLKRFYRPL